MNQRRPKEKGALVWAAAPLLQSARVTPEQPGLSSLWEALAQRAQAGPGTQEVSGATAPLLPSLGDAAGRHPRLAGPTGTSALPAEGNRHKAAAHTMAGLCTRRNLQPSPPRGCLHSHLGNEGR